ncbi:piggyBac transposable element-derived protein 4-like isoform X3 [Penaeus japonicus]|uniref:piggyBac transposable element-derived protein 4-like isoform X3 n=1 Tax=Penaeus japonicus TaxID=27405 RepID=UPI001C70B69A|nr:piggyBac transposable element-derived protein 4-like isoform X3 [Penaeus japonicus]
MRITYPDYQRYWNNEECRIQWEENEKHVGERLTFDGIPFIILGSKLLGCQYGVPNQGKNGRYTEWKQEQEEPSHPRRGQCPAKVVLREVIKFPDYKIDNNNSYEKKKFSKMLRDDLTLGAARSQRRIYVELPASEAHVHTVLVKKVNEASIIHTNSPHCLVCNAKLSASARSAVALFSGEMAPYSASCSAAVAAEGIDDHAVSSTSTMPPPQSDGFNVYDFSSDDSDEDEFLPMGRNCLLSDSSDDASDSDSELSFVSQLGSIKDSDEQSTFEMRAWDPNAPGLPAFVWQKKENVVKQSEFLAHPRVNIIDLHQGSTAFEIYSHFVTPELMDHLVHETNRYYYQQPAPPASSHTRKWRDTSREELHAYFGLRLLMGMQPKPDMKMYWSLDPIFNQPVFPETMPRDRFLQLTHNLHAVDNRGSHPADDRLWKLRPVISMLNQQFSSVYTPPRRITVNESLWRFQGRFCNINFTHNKRARFGVKMHKLCVCNEMTAGYTSAFKIYAGQDESELPTSMDTIINLMTTADLFGKGYELYTDSWYTSPSLFHYLQSHHTNAVGTVLTNCKDMPRDLQVKTHGKVDFRSTPTGILCLQWLDKKLITMLSTAHDAEMVKDKSQCSYEHTKPRVVSDYKAGKKGIYLSNQLAQSYPIVQKSIRWYKKVLFYLFDMAVINSFCVHKALGGMLTHLEFKMQLIRELLREITSTRKEFYRSQGRSPIVSSERRLQGATTHHQQLTPGKKYRRCKICRQNGKRKMTKTICSTNFTPTVGTSFCLGEYHRGRHAGICPPFKHRVQQVLQPN